MELVEFHKGAVSDNAGPKILDYGGHGKRTVLQHSRIHNVRKKVLQYWPVSHLTPFSAASFKTRSIKSDVFTGIIGRKLGCLLTKKFASLVYP